MPDQKFNLETTKVIFGLINNKIFQPINLDLNEEHNSSKESQPIK
jgi:hypothetical protein